jgi:hypothetical protein
MIFRRGRASTFEPNPWSSSSVRRASRRRDPSSWGHSSNRTLHSESLSELPVAASLLLLLLALSNEMEVYLAFLERRKSNLEKLLDKNECKNRLTFRTVAVRCMLTSTWWRRGIGLDLLAKVYNLGLLGDWTFNLESV